MVNFVLSGSVTPFGLAATWACWRRCVSPSAAQTRTHPHWAESQHRIVRATRAAADRV
jgi:hypothetical protein